jgi:hypothetical protein
LANCRYALVSNLLAAASMDILLSFSQGEGAPVRLLKSQKEQFRSWFLKRDFKL